MELNFRTPAWTQMSEVQFLMGYQNVFLGPMLMARNKKSSSFFATMLKIYQLFYSNYHNITPKNLALNHNTWLVIFFLLLVTFLLENVLIWWGEISFLITLRSNKVTNVMGVSVTSPTVMLLSELTVAPARIV